MSIEIGGGGQPLVTLGIQTTTGSISHSVFITVFQNNPLFNGRKRTGLTEAVNIF
jgi:hypothetical protein